MSHSICNGTPHSLLTCRRKLAGPWRSITGNAATAAAPGTAVGSHRVCRSLATRRSPCKVAFSRFYATLQGMHATLAYRARVDSKYRVQQVGSSSSQPQLASRSNSSQCLGPAPASASFAYMAHSPTPYIRGSPLVHAWLPSSACRNRFPPPSGRRKMQRHIHQVFQNLSRATRAAKRMAILTNRPVPQDFGTD